jgi:26S proteasome regulatory subunit N12
VANNEIAEFHSELETLENPEADQNLAYPIRLERWLMEGSYDKVWKTITQQSEFPSPEYAILAESLVATVRTEIALCSERAYASLPVANARHLLFFKTDQEIIEFASHRDNWTVKNGRIYFPHNADDGDDQDVLPHLGSVPAESVISHTLDYAQKIETII